MNFLKTLGRWIIAGIKIEAGLAPLVRGIYPQAAGIVDKVTDELTQLSAVVVTVESLGAATGLPGPDKARVAGPLIGQLVQQSAFMVGKEIADPAAYAAACKVIAGGFADLLNSLKAPKQP